MKKNLEQKVHEDDVELHQYMQEAEEIGNLIFTGEKIYDKYLQDGVVEIQTLSDFEAFGFYSIFHSPQGLALAVSLEEDLHAHMSGALNSYDAVRKELRSLAMAYLAIPVGAQRTFSTYENKELVKHTPTLRFRASEYSPVSVTPLYDSIIARICQGDDLLLVDSKTIHPLSDKYSA